MYDIMKCSFDWFFSIKPEEKEHQNEKNRLENTMKTTSISRYNASERLKLRSMFSFFTTTILSLGLIFIPLIQMANVKLAFSEEILSVVQVFLAVAVLVYSVIIGTAHYDIRSHQLTKCGNELKDLIRDLRADEKNKDFTETRKKYSHIISSVENHGRNDFLLTKLRTHEIYSITGIVWFFNWVMFFTLSLIPYIIPIVLIAIECVFISDMFNVTKFFTPYLIKG